jgi:hypothetical protein
MRKKLLLLGLLALLIGPSVTWAQSLGDVARAEEARRKTVKKPAKVYTNDDLKRNGGDSSSAPAPAAQPAAAGAAKPGDGAAKTEAAKTDQPAKTDDQAKDEKYWRTRITAPRETLAHDKVLLDALQSRMNALDTDFANISDPAQRAVVEGNRKTARAEITRITQDIEKQTKSINDVQEEARKASVPPGWLR